MKKLTIYKNITVFVDHSIDENCFFIGKLSDTLGKTQEETNLQYQNTLNSYHTFTNTKTQKYTEINPIPLSSIDYIAGSSTNIEFYQTIIDELEQL